MYQKLYIALVGILAEHYTDTRILEWLLHFSVKHSQISTQLPEIGRFELSTLEFHRHKASQIADVGQ